VDRLDGSGIDTLVIGATANDTAVVPLAFAGNVALSLGNTVEIHASELDALAAGTTSFQAPAAGTTSIGAPTVSISAPYVQISGPTDIQLLRVTLDTTPALADATLDVSADFIDIDNKVGLKNFAQASFVSSGDIR